MNPNIPKATYDTGSFGTANELRLARNEGPCCLQDSQLTTPLSDSLNRYPDYSRLLTAYSEFVGVPSERLVVSAGGDEGIDRVIRTAVSGARRDVVVHAPSFEMFDIYATQAGGSIKSVPWFDGDFPFDAFAATIDSDTALVIVVSPNNPTGQVIPLEVLLKLASHCAERDVLLLVDLAYVEFADNDPTPGLLQCKNVILVRTLSKAWGLAGLRVGFLLTPDRETARCLQTFGGPFTISNVSQQYAIEALTSATQAMRRNSAQIKKIRGQLTQKLVENNIQVLASQGNFVLARFSQKNIAEQFRDCGVQIRAFLNRPFLEDWVRITCPNSLEENAGLISCIDLLCHNKKSQIHLQTTSQINNPSVENGIRMIDKQDSNQARRAATKTRNTNETQIVCSLQLDGTGQAQINTGLGFFDHMLTALTKHSGIDLTLNCIGDLNVDDHHTIEDCAIAIGEALALALGERRGVRRFGYAYCPLDEALARVVLDLSGRPWPEIHLGLMREKIGDTSTENLTHFFQSLAINLKCSLHVDVLRGSNDHHRAEAAFKALALALKDAIQIISSEIPSTKGTLT